ncbi:mitochondrial import receptor subunit Tom22p [Monosporozyma unispora]|mgnify:CR=1 FL=1|nr:mitochondrial import receptor protein [Kazachstania unispora]
MVELTEINDDENVPVQEPQVVPAEPVNTEEKDLFPVSKKDESDESDDSDFDDDFDENETLLDRVIALKEIIPPKQRQCIVESYNSTTSFVKTVFAKGGSLTWALTTSALLLGVPLSLSILSEQQLIEMEKTFDLQKGANDLLGQTEEAKVADATV